MGKFRNIILAILLCLTSKFAFGQIPLLANFDDKEIHFGFIVGYNQMLFDLKMKENIALRDTVLSTNSFYSPGFHVGIVSDLRLNNYLNLRFNPGLSFTERSIEYRVVHEEFPEIGKLITKKAESVYMDVPLELKIRSHRWRNFRPYIIVGGKYTFDWASLKNVKPEEEEEFLRLAPHDVLVTGGFGFDFYLQYFKFAIELKMSFGMLDLFVADKTYLTRSVDKITSRVFNLTFTFE